MATSVPRWACYSVCMCCRFGNYETNMGIVYMGIMIVAACIVAIPIYFPPWGGMLFPARSGATEEEVCVQHLNQIHGFDCRANAHC
jgi:hypothetical protein